MSVKQAIVKETGHHDFQVDIDVSGHHLRGDEPQDAGGGDTGPAPYDFLIAALGACTVMTIRWYARRHDFPLEHASAVVTHEKRDGVDVFIKNITITGAALSEEQRSKLLDVAAKCPVHKTLIADPVIETHWA